MDKTAQGVGRNHTQGPHYQKNHKNGPKHVMVPPAISLCSWKATFAQASTDVHVQGLATGAEEIQGACRRLTGDTAIQDELRRITAAIRNDGKEHVHTGR